MSLIEQVLEPNTTATPTCVCGQDMRLEQTTPHALAEDVETREFGCDCGHTMKVMVWKDI